MQTPNSIVSRQNTPLIVELVGLAGAGKTTLAKALSQQNAELLVADELQLRKITHLPIFATHLPSLLPVLLRSYRPDRWFTWEEIKAMVYLKGWPQMLKQQATNNSTAILLDHGPIFKLATLNAFGPKRLKSPGFEGWWQEMFKLWASTLDMVIWLEGSRTNLIERINSRKQKHFVKGKSEQEASQFLDRYQLSYEEILVNLKRYREPALLQFDTSHTSVGQIVDEVGDMFNLKVRELYVNKRETGVSIYPH